ncbi:MAG: hypothetical protein K6T78_09000 [Alicyclobacillus sp.]|nr:hypothetical protein [Alicyclobacillus sp.]
MPASLNDAILFLETQWSSINENKTKGVLAEIRFTDYLNSLSSLFEYQIPGGWILTPNKPTGFIPAQKRIVIIPVNQPFSWSSTTTTHPFTAQVIAHSYFRQAGMEVYFAYADPAPTRSSEVSFTLPARRNYQRSYPLTFHKVSSSGLQSVPEKTVMRNFTSRRGAIGLRAYQTGRLNRCVFPWNDPSIVTSLFWKEYVKYYLQVRFLISNNDLDFFLVANSGRSFPVEFKSKTPGIDPSIGDFFGIDVAPFVKLSYFISLSNNMDALFVVEEIDDSGATIEWWGIKFSDLLKNCSWFSSAGGEAMTGGPSTTVRVPKLAFTRLDSLLPTL